jgi:hypothetical protein
VSALAFGVAQSHGDANSKASRRIDSGNNSVLETFLLCIKTAGREEEIDSADGSRLFAGCCGADISLHFS